MANKNFEEAQLELELGDKPVIAKVDQFNDRWQVSLRFLYFHPNTGEKTFSKHGINIPLGDFETAVDAMCSVVNDATGSSYALVNEE